MGILVKIVFENNGRIAALMAAVLEDALELVIVIKIVGFWQNVAECYREEDPSTE